MSYYTNISGSFVTTHPEKIKKIINDCFGPKNHTINLDQQEYQKAFRFEELNVSTETVYINCYVKWYYNLWNEFLERTKYCITEGSIHCTGEDDEAWGYYFHDNEWQEYNPIIIYPDDIGYEEFLKLSEKLND